MTSYSNNISPSRSVAPEKHVRKLWIYFGHHQQLISTLNARHRRMIIEVYMPLPVRNGTTLAPAIHPSTISAQL